MARRLLRKYLPDRHRLMQARALRWVGHLLHQPNLWHLNRDSVARGCAVGMFWSCVPVPFQMLPAATSALWFRGNLAISLVLTWLSNPLTMGPQIYISYRLGRWLLRQPPGPDFDPSLTWLWQHLAQAWLPLLAGVLIIATTISLGSYFLVKLLWRWYVVRMFHKRRARRRLRIIDSPVVRLAEQEPAES
jgi:uncharacterized protein